MRRRKPSASIVISVIALVFAMTGTGIAAKSALIDGSQIKDGTITAKKLRRDIIVPKGYSLVYVPTPKSDKATRSQAAVGPRGTSTVFSKTVVNDRVQIALECPDELGGTTTTLVPLGGECPPTPASIRKEFDSKLNKTEQNATSYTDTAISSIIDPNKTLLPAVTALQNEPNGMQSNRVTVPTGVVASVVFAPLTGQVTASPDFAGAQTATPAVPVKFRDVSVVLTRPSASNTPTGVTVALVVNNGTVSGTGASCTFDPRSATGCTFAGPIQVPANATAAWVVTTTGQVGGPPAPWGAYDLSLGYATDY